MQSATQARRKVHLRYDDDGLPILSPAQIEELTLIFLQHYCPDCLRRATPTKLTAIVARLKEKSAATFVFDKDLGSHDGAKILGKIDFRRRIIWIDSSLEEGGPVFTFTLAHEIAHLALHRNMGGAVAQARLVVLTDHMRRVFPLDREPSDKSDRLEWQANRFAAALLMPLPTLKRLVYDVLGKRSVSEMKRSFIHYDDQVENIGNYQAVVQYCRKYFAVSYTVIRIRLKETGILIDARRTSDIAELLAHDVWSGTILHRTRRATKPKGRKSNQPLRIPDSSR